MTAVDQDGDEFHPLIACVTLAVATSVLAARSAALRAGVTAQTIRRSRRQLEESHHLLRRLAALEIDLRPFGVLADAEFVADRIGGSTRWVESNERLPRRTASLTETSLDIVKWRVQALRGEIGAVKSALEIGTEIASVAASMRIQVTLTWLTVVLVLTLVSVVIGVEASYYGVHHSLWWSP
ncbi:MAG TPA: hypothetical protein VHS27_22420 [Gaiellales bacterium]|nr:hypothetical protein [Gaiellales bacterium]